jgi:hypothetical protein
MHGEPREDGPLLHTEIVLCGVREVIISEIEDPQDAVPYHERRIYVYGKGGDVTTIVLRSTPGRRSNDLAITYCGRASVLAS